MADVFSKAKRSLVMAAIRSKGNKNTELRLISILRANKITGWRRNQRLPGKPDFVFRRERLAVFVDGCFWHGCPLHGRKPGSNRKYWIGKLRRNEARDTEVKNNLRLAGWNVLRIWEHDLIPAANALKKIRSSLQKRRIAVEMDRL
jgi:DNA mismatch endonuclease, patch repair protein